jgi:hypothetical protein
MENKTEFRAVEMKHRSVKVRLIFLCSVLLLCIFASVYFYFLPQIDEWRLRRDAFINNNFSKEFLTSIINHYDSMYIFFLDEFDEFKSLFSFSTIDYIDEMIKYIRDYRDNIPEEINDWEWFEMPEYVVDFVFFLYLFTDDFNGFMNITEEQIINSENLTAQERETIINSEHNMQKEAMYQASLFLYADIRFLLFNFSARRYDETGMPIVDHTYFNFVNDIEFIKFNQTGKAFCAELNEYIYYFYIETNDDNGLVIGDLSGHEWELRIQVTFSDTEDYDVWRRHIYFYPVGHEKVRQIIPSEVSDAVAFCLIYSTEKFFESHGGYIVLAAELVSEEIIDDVTIVVINYYGDNNYYFLMRTIRYELEFNEKEEKEEKEGWQIVSIETIYEASDVNFSTFTLQSDS